ncbi:MAG: hypothetical protein ACRDYA_14150 [Egibacteraceae bacterium]
MAVCHQPQGFLEALLDPLVGNGATSQLLLGLLSLLADGGLLALEKVQWNGLGVMSLQQLAALGLELGQAFA